MSVTESARIQSPYSAYTRSRSYERV